MKKPIKNVLVIVAHPDDESFGCGGLIKKFVNKNYKVGVISFTNGVSSREKFSDNKIKKRKKDSFKASKILGFKWLGQYNYPDNQMDKLNLLEIIKIIEFHKKKFSPKIIITHSFYDLNIDHRTVAEATLTAFRPEPGEICEEILTFEIPSSTDYRMLKNSKNFIPNYFINIEKYLSSKIKAIKCYSDEIKKTPHSRSIDGVKNLSKTRGNQSGMKNAEAYEIIRKIEKK